MSDLSRRVLHGSEFIGALAWWTLVTSKLYHQEMVGEELSFHNKV